MSLLRAIIMIIIVTVIAMEAVFIIMKDHIRPNESFESPRKSRDCWSSGWGADSYTDTVRYISIITIISISISSISISTFISISISIIVYLVKYFDDNNPMLQIWFDHGNN